MTDLLKDVRFAARALAKTPAVTLAALFALALGIGANSAIFSVVDGVLLEPLPYGEPDRLVMAIDSNPSAGFPRFSSSPPNFADWRDQSTFFSHLCAFQRSSFNLTSADADPEHLTGAKVSGDFFDMMAVRPLAGRGFIASEDKPGAGHVAVLSHSLWQRRYGADPAVVGRKLTLDGEPYTVVGVMPPSFAFPTRAELWVPLAVAIDPNQRGAHYWGVAGRLKPGATREQAQAEMTGIAARLEKQYPNTDEGWGVNLVPLRELVVEDIRPALLVLMATVGLVLLIACANVANLLLARMTARSREVAIRSALGAGRGRLVRQFLTESLLLAAAGGALGLLLAYWGTKSLLALGGDSIPRAASIGLHPPVLFFTLGLSLLTGLIFGLVPALHASRADLQGTLKEGGRSATAGRGAGLARGSLVLGEVALAIVLLVGAGLLLRSFSGLQHVSPGFDSQKVLTLRVDLPSSKYRQDAAQAGFFRDAVPRLAALPGVESAGAGFPLPLAGSSYILSFTVQGRPVPKPNDAPNASIRFVTPGFLETLKVPLVRGRRIGEEDTPDVPQVAVVNQQLVHKLFRDEDPIGQRLTFGDPTKPDVQWMTVVGVVGDVRHDALAVDPDMEIYVPIAQQSTDIAHLVVRTAGDPTQLAGAVRAALAEIDPDLPVFQVRSFDKVVADSLARQRFSATLVSLFAFVALLLAAVGVYGVISYSVAQRTHEMGVRMALGADRGDVLALVVRQGMVPVAAGVALGLVAAFPLARLLRSFLFGIGSADPVTFAAVPAVLLAVALLASWLPALRATRVAPLVALRQD